MPKKPTQKELIARATKLGKAGFKAGKKAPAQDAKCIKMLEAYREDHNMIMKILDAYNKGWHEEQTKYTDELLKQKRIITPRMKTKKR